MTNMRYLCWCKLFKKVFNPIQAALPPLADLSKLQAVRASTSWMLSQEKKYSDFLFCLLLVSIYDFLFISPVCIERQYTVVSYSSFCLLHKLFSHTPPNDEMFGCSVKLYFLFFCFSIIFKKLKINTDKNSQPGFQTQTL